MGTVMPEIRGATPVALEKIWEPLQIGSTRVRNRIMMTAQTTLFGKDHILGDRHVEYYRERAKGGVALFICEQQAAHRLSKGSFYEGCTAWEPRAIPQFAKLAEAVHEHGGRQFVQLFGCGVHDKGTTIFDEWHPLWGVSAIPSVYHHEIPMVMEKAHIQDVVKGFGQSAAHVKVAGCDGVEIHGAHSYLVGQFLSRAYNTRTDEYGGSVANRARVVVEIGEEIRRRVGPDFTVGLRISYDEFLGPAGITIEESDETVALLAATGLFDFFNISAGGYHTLFKAVAPTGSTHGEFLPFARRAKAIVGDRAKVFTVGRITTLSMAEAAIRDGTADMVAMTRAMMADPYHVRKTREGRADEIVFCVGANECINRAFNQRPVTCVMNPAVGREGRWQKDNLRLVSGGESKRILVVGGGPAGCRTAELLGRRGHRVTLAEAAPALGGHLRDLVRLPSWKEWGLAIDNLERNVKAANVEVCLSTAVTAESVERDRPDVVVVATGATWDRTGLTPYRPDRATTPGADQPHVHDLMDAIRRVTDEPKALGDNVVILDDTGSYPPLALAHLLTRAATAAKVTVITPRDTAGADLIGRGEIFLIMPLLLEAGVTVHSQCAIDRIDGPEVTMHSIWGGKPAMLSGVTAVVLALTRSPRDSLYQSIRDRHPHVVRIGDCLAPRSLVQVMHEAEETGRSL
jgi:2,4-dienoyl-CoA reductase-like NADH-dependent reductase (Old Yellow Enzyme family)